MLKTISPVNNQVYCERSYASDSEIAQALNLATEAQREWRHTKIKSRLAICESMLDYFERNQTDIAEELSWQMGRPCFQALHELRVMADRARYMMSIAEASLQSIFIEESADFHRFIKRNPWGVVFVIAPWNYPYLTAINSIVPAILAGNSVILKHASQTSLCGERFASAFDSTDLPKGVFQSLILDYSQVGKLIENDIIQYVIFTGSVNGGKRVQLAANKRFIPVGLELGGKDPAYVRADADVDNAVEHLVDGAFFNSGQSCCGIERIYVDQHCYDDFVSSYVDKAKQYNIGDPFEAGVDLGPMVSVRAANVARTQLRMAIQGGAQALLPFDNYTAKESAYLAPQVLVNVNHQMAVMREESFAPLIGIMPVSGDEEAIRLMNDSEFGLTASVWTDDHESAISIGDRIETGTFFMNRCDYLDPALVWTGVKNSGRGYSLSKLGFEQLTRAKSYHLKTEL